MREVFRLFDTDGSGSMDANELRIVMWALGFQPKKNETQRMVAEFFGREHTDSGSIDIDASLDEEDEDDMIKEESDEGSDSGGLNLQVPQEIMQEMSAADEDPEDVLSMEQFIRVMGPKIVNSFTLN